MDLDVVMRSSDCDYIVKFYGALFTEVIMRAKNVQNLAVTPFPCTSGLWFHLSFEHFMMSFLIWSIRERPLKTAVDLLNGLIVMKFCKLIADTAKLLSIKLTQLFCFICLF